MGVLPYAVHLIIRLKLPGMSTRTDGYLERLPGGKNLPPLHLLSSLYQLFGQSKRCTREAGGLGVAWSWASNNESR